VTGTEVALIITASSAMVTSLGGMIVGLRNSRKIDAVHKSTNGLSERNEAIARKLGVEEGKREEKGNPS
jgi:hypothetical protein